MSEISKEGKKMTFGEKPYWCEPAWVSQMIDQASAEEATWSQADFEAKFASDEETTDITTRNNMGGGLHFSVQRINRAIAILKGEH